MYKSLKQTSKLREFGSKKPETIVTLKGLNNFNLDLFSSFKIKITTRKRLKKLECSKKQLIRSLHRFRINYYYSLQQT